MSTYTMINDIIIDEYKTLDGLNQQAGKVEVLEDVNESAYPGADKVIQLDVSVGNFSILPVCKPKAGHLRGLKLLDVIQMDSVSFAKLIPRIALNGFTEQNFNQLDPVDLLEVMTEVASFFTKDQL